jgi:NADH:ubiquinone oxidoreductase subunit D
LIHFIRKVREIHYILTSSRLWRTRLYEIGITEKDFRSFPGLTGIIARSSNILIDARFTGYEYHHSIDWSVFLASSGDSLDRYPLRMNEVNESSRIVYGVLWSMLFSNMIFYLVSFLVFIFSLFVHKQDIERRL